MYPPFIYNCLKYCLKKDLISKNDKIIIAVSGGVDSCCLLHFLFSIQNEYSLQLNVVHFNHQLRESSDQEQIFVADLCKKLNLPYMAFSPPQPLPKSSLQLAARNWRKEKLLLVRQEIGFDKIALGHHKDDLAETILWKIARGSSLFNLGNLKPQNGFFIRPLLDIEKQKIVDFMSLKGLDWCDDISNFSNKYTRNIIRNKILPFISQELEKNFSEKLCQLAVDSQLLNDLFIEKTNSIDYRQNFLLISEIINLPKFILNELLQRWLNHNQLTVNRAKLAEICKLLKDKSRLGKVIILNKQTQAVFDQLTISLNFCNTDKKPNKRL